MTEQHITTTLEASAKVEGSYQRGKCIDAVGDLVDKADSERVTVNRIDFSVGQAEFNIILELYSEKAYKKKDHTDIVSRFHEDFVGIFGYCFDFQYETSKELVEESEDDSE